MSKSGEARYLVWILNYLKTDEFAAKDDAISSGAYAIERSTNTTEDYLKKLTSPSGPLVSMKHPETGVQIITLKGRKISTPALDTIMSLKKMARQQRSPRPVI